MNKGFQLIVAFVAFLTLGLTVAVSVGTGDYGLPIVIGVGALALVLMATIGRHLALDVTILCLSVGAFYVLGKGYAYINAGGFLFTGELTLLICLLGYLYRLGNRVYPLIPKTLMAPALLLLGCYALIRLPIDYGVYGLMAMRDACVIYYTLFFFIAYQLGKDPKVQKLAPIILISMAVPGILLDFMLFAFPGIQGPVYSLKLMGNPIFLNHYDAIHPAAFGMILFLATKASNRFGLNIFYFLAMFFVTAYLLGIGRGANYVTFMFICAFLLIARQFKILVGMAGGVVVLACALLILIEINPSTGRGRLRQISEQIEVLVDPSQITSGKTTDSDTADWRLQWWTKITNDVNATNPIFGLGFGYDIASDFHRQFFRTARVDRDISRTRGAHNAFFTVLARLGWLGALFFLGVVGVQLTYFWRAALAFRNGEIPPSQAFFWGSNLCAFIITFFQYAWEASYSAIPAWTCMGFSYAYLDQLRDSKRTEAAVEDGESEERPAALAPPPVAAGRRVPRPRLAQPSA